MSLSVSFLLMLPVALTSNRCGGARAFYAAKIKQGELRVVALALALALAKKRAHFSAFACMCMCA